MMGRMATQEQLFYQFRLEDHGLLTTCCGGSINSLTWRRSGRGLLRFMTPSAGPRLIPSW